MDKVNKTPSIVNIQRFPQREEEQKKTKKKYPNQRPFSEALSEVFEEQEEDEESPFKLTLEPEQPDGLSSLKAPWES